MTKVLHVITGLGPGGAEAVLTQLALALQKNGMEQHVVSLTGPGLHAKTLADGGVGVSALEIGSPWQAPAAMMRLAYLVWRQRPDIVQGWMYHGNVAASFAQRVAARHASLLWNIRASNMDEARYGRVIGWNARLSRWPDVVITNSRASVQFHQDHGFRARRLTVISNGIDVEKYRPLPKLRAKMRKELGLAADAVVAVNVARVDPMKDHQCFLDAVSGVPEVHGLLVGSGTDQLDLPPNVTALGLRHDVDHVHQAADLIVSSSAYGEGFSNALAEGMSSGLVPVATDVGDARLIVGDTGRIVPLGSAEILGAAIEAEARLAPPARRARGEAARQHIVENFTIGKMVELFTGIYSSLPARPAAEPATPAGS